MTVRNLLVACAAVAWSGCGEPERNPPAPPGGSAGSVTLGGASAGTTAGTTAGMDTGLGDPTGSTGTGGGSEESGAGPTTVDPGTGDTGLTSGPDTATGGASCVVGAGCEGDGICVEQISADGVVVVCTHGTPGEPCQIDRHCDSLMCVSEVTRSGVVSTCA